MSTIIDFHSHILPGMDDGSETAEMSEQMLKLSKEQGIDVIAATPHFYAEQMTLDMFLKRRETAFLTIQDAAACRGISLLLGAEAAFFPGIGNAGGIQQLTIGAHRFSFLKCLPGMEQPRYRGGGTAPCPWNNSFAGTYRAVYSLSKRRRMIRRLYSLPILAQVNGGALLNWRTSVWRSDCFPGAWLICWDRIVTI